MKPIREGTRLDWEGKHMRQPRRTPFKALLEAAKFVAVRFPLEWKTDFENKQCACNQFLDIGECRHLILMKAIVHAEQVQK